MVRQKIKVKGTEIVIFSQKKKNYISLTDIAKHKNPEAPRDIIKNWIRTRSTIEFIGIWEQIHNPNFKQVEFDLFKNEAGSNAFVLSPQKWIDTTGAMKAAGIKGSKLSEDNRKQIDNYFNKFLPRGKKKRVFENISGDLIPVDTTEKMDRTGIRVSELERDRTAFLSEDYETEVGEANKFVLEYINELRGRPEDKQQNSPFLNLKILWKEKMKSS